MSEVGQSQVVADHHMRVDRVGSRPRKVLIVVANPSTSTTLGWPVGFWGAELTHPYYELRARNRGNDRQPRRGTGRDGLA
jgi:hypothetical protein